MIRNNAVFWDVKPVALVRIDVSGKLIVSIIRVKGIGELGTPLTLISNRRMVASYG
jgi:hypothetical protein